MHAVGRRVGPTPQPTPRLLLNTRHAPASGRRRVVSGAVKAANPPEIEEHIQAVAHHTDLGSLGVVPPDRYFDRVKPKLLREIKHFHIEAEPLQPLPAAYFAGWTAAEELEAALCVFERQARG